MVHILDALEGCHEPLTKEEIQDVLEEAGRTISISHVKKLLTHYVTRGLIYYNRNGGMPEYILKKNFRDDHWEDVNGKNFGRKMVKKNIWVQILDEIAHPENIDNLSKLHENRRGKKIGASTAWNSLSKLARQGLITKVDRGIYCSNAIAGDYNLKTSGTNRLVSILEEAQKPLTVKRIMILTRLTNDQPVHNALSKLVLKGRITRLERGFYCANSVADKFREKEDDFEIPERHK